MVGRRITLTRKQIMENLDIEALINTYMTP
jgi:hypothetical protein